METFLNSIFFFVIFFISSVSYFHCDIFASIIYVWQCWFSNKSSRQFKWMWYLFRMLYIKNWLCKGKWINLIIYQYLLYWCSTNLRMINEFLFKVCNKKQRKRLISIKSMRMLYIIVFYCFMFVIIMILFYHSFIGLKASCWPLSIF